MTGKSMSLCVTYVPYILTDFLRPRLEKEERGGNWLYNIDQLAPLEIYD